MSQSVVESQNGSKEKVNDESQAQAIDEEKIMNEKISTVTNKKTRKSEATKSNPKRTSTGYNHKTHATASEETVIEVKNDDDDGDQHDHAAEKERATEEHIAQDEEQQNGIQQHDGKEEKADQIFTDSNKHMEPLVLAPDEQIEPEVIREKSDEELNSKLVREDDKLEQADVNESIFLSTLRDGRPDRVIASRRSIHLRPTNVKKANGSSLRDSLGIVNMSFFSYSPSAGVSVKRKMNVSDSTVDEGDRKRFRSSFMSTIVEPFRTRLMGGGVNDDAVNSTPELTCYHDSQIGEISHAKEATGNNGEEKKWCAIM